MVAIQAELEKFPGVCTVEFEPAEVDVDDGGVLPAGITLTFSPDASGIHSLEFIVWALGDMKRAGADVRHYLRSPPPWLNEPGRSMTMEIYVYPRSDDLQDTEAVAETETELQQMSEFLEWAYDEHWAACAPR